MNRLPTYDAGTRKVEHRFFLGLSLAAAALIVLTVADATRFSEARQDIIAALSEPGTTVAQSGRAGATTNLAAFHAGQPGETPRVQPALRPKS
jgi:hypothetical protein